MVLGPIKALASTSKISGQALRPSENINMALNSIDNLGRPQAPVPTYRNSMTILSIRENLRVQNNLEVL